MRDEYSKKSKLSWSRKLVEKWFNIKGKTEEFQSDESVRGGSYERRTSISDWDHCTMKKIKTEKSTRGMEHPPWGSVDLDRPQIISVQNYRVFVSTWNVGGESPPSNLNLDEWLHSSPPADIYVLGFQEIVPLNAGNILGVEDNGPAKKWMALIGKTLNSGPGTSGGNGCYTSPVPDPIAEWNADFEGSKRHKASSFFHRRSFQTPQCGIMENDPSILQPRMDGRYSVCDRVILGHRSSDFDPNIRWEQRQSDYTSAHWPSDYSSCHRPSDYSSGHRLSDYSCGQRPSDFSKWGSSDDDYGPADSPTASFSPVTNGVYAPMEDGYRMPKNSTYCLAASKQMVGIFLTVWMRSDLREHVGNMKISCVGRGLMGYLRNKGSISISMQLHQTSFCFVCSHLTSGQKKGDELRRNSDVMEILKKTRFLQVSGAGEEKSPSPETILEHDRVIWLGDLNYRIALSYHSAKALVEMQNWRALLGNDQLRIEQRRGRVFVGWKEGKIYFPPTYKYSRNSDKYAGEDIQPKEKRRTPAWCDRILWHGRGFQQLSYVRGESRFSDHRAIFSIFWVEVESVRNRLRKMSCSSSRIEVEELLPYAHGYTELCFF
ncbi:type IV inositol polyphosphate 5-phosphatase 7-like [Nicotiana tabacum]|uniref:Type IV inositol polyphosphate 5-phosphatase 7-like n=1 Tax=Nicotiana tabacum TaxID=4097 RepID=A0A1S4CPN5_TOBAC